VVKYNESRPGAMLLKILVRTIGLLIVLLSCVIVSFLLVGEEPERRRWEAAPTTLDLYTTGEVCLDPQSNHVLNCGQCGSCSNKHDIRIYYETRQTLTETMTSCGSGDFLFGIDAWQCLKEKAGMTDLCTSCWVLNYKCNIENCVNTCLKQRFFSFIPSLVKWQSEPLNNWIACDEKLCGPVFVACAGANRRRVGVVSDLQRDAELEICDRVDWDWMLGTNTDESLVENGDTDDEMGPSSQENLPPLSEKMKDDL
jgi:hypothetical protein